jgi:hypothetical protein
MLNFCGIVVAILKIATGRNEFLRYCGGHFENGDRKFDMWVDNDVPN